MPVFGITGAAGYLGGALAAALARQGTTSRLVDDLSGPVSRGSPGTVRAGFASEEGLRALQDSDVVIHLAAVSGVMACAEHPEESRLINVAGLARLASWCREAGIPLAFASSMAVVGAPRTMPITETSPAAPSHEYARQKAEGEAIVRGLSSGGPGSAIVRMTNLYGSYLRDGTPVAKGNVLNLFAQQAAAGTLRINAPGTQRRDFLHIDDAVAGWIALGTALCESRSPPGLPTLAFASGQSYSVREIAELVRDVWLREFPRASPPSLNVVPNPRGSIELLDERFAVDPSRTWAALKLRPRHTVEGDLPAILRGASPTP